MRRPTRIADLEAAEAAYRCSAEAIRLDEDAPKDEVESFLEMLRDNMKELREDQGQDAANVDF